MQGSVSQEKKSLQKFLKNRQETAKRRKKEKTEGATGLGRITRAHRQMESNDSPEIPDRGESTEESGLPSCQKKDFESIKYR